MVVIVYGDAQKREEFMLPKSLDALQKKCQSLFGFYCELYIDLGKVGRGETSWSNRHIRNETDFSFIQNGDVVIVVDPSGRRVELAKLFDGLTTYRKDYVKHPLKKRAPLGPQEFPVEDIPDLSALMYRTTYRSHYTPKKGDPKQSLEGAEYPERLTSGTGITTYQHDYVPKELDAEPKPEEDFREIAKPFLDWTTTYKKDFVPKRNLQTPAEVGGKRPDPDPGAPWRPTEYVDEYTPKKSQPVPGPGDGFDQEYEPSTNALPWGTTYNKDYVPHPSRQGTIFADPELEASS